MGWAAAALPGLPVVQAGSVQFSHWSYGDEPDPHTSSGEPCTLCAMDRWVSSEAVVEDSHLHAL